jgi:aspartate/methionine/tyrosine aminotransferase
LQANIYAANRTFTSFKQMVRQLQSSAMLVSLHSTSKGFVGECGRRGGYMEVVNFPAGGCGTAWLFLLLMPQAARLHSAKYAKCKCD